MTEVFLPVASPRRQVTGKYQKKVRAVKVGPSGGGRAVLCRGGGRPMSIGWW